jgi:divalent metal cation (Fe/Co/Zn/Cd) transporter
MDRSDLLRRATLLSVASIALNALMGGIAVVAALSSGSLALLGFGFDAMIDSAASVALVWRFRIETTAPHRAERVEQIAETVIGAVLLLLAAYLAIMSVRALFEGTHPEPTLIGAALLGASVVLLPPLARAKYVVARRLGSGALRADSLLTAMTSLLAVIALAGLVLVIALGVGWADAVGALAVAVVLAREGRSSFAVRHQPRTAN